jgi:hypothetical protein
MADKARRERVSLGSSEIEGFQMPDGSYRMSQTQAAEAIGKDEINARRFLDSKAIKALLGKGYTPDSIEVESTDQQRGQTRINALPLEVVTAFWIWQCSRGNKSAIALVMATATETLERRFDRAFGVARTDDEYNQRLAERLQQTERQLQSLGEAYAQPDVLLEHVAQLEEQIRQLGGEPWQLPEQDAEE